MLEFFIIFPPYMKIGVSEETSIFFMIWRNNEQSKVLDFFKRAV